MARTPRRRALLLLAFAAAPLVVNAQLTNLPDLSTATQATATSDATTAESTTDASTTAATTDATTTNPTSAESTQQTTTTATFGLSDLPTIAGAGIPNLYIPYTAGAPFMQKSSYPEGTVFIAVGAVLAFLGACVLLWRGLVAWSINRSVKRAALASIRGNEKSSAWGGGSGYNPINGGGGKSSIYDSHSYAAGSSMSLDALGSNGKPLGKPHFRDHEIRRESTPPNGLFFSPTAQAGSGAADRNSHYSQRNSALLPAGYYASTSAQTPDRTTIGGSLAPYAQRHSTYGPSPPESPGLPPQSRNSTHGTPRAASRDAAHRNSRLTPGTRDLYGDGSARVSGYFESSNGGQQRQSHAGASGLYARPNSSSLMVGRQGSSENLPGSRAPSAYLEDLFQEHGNGPRERF